MALRNFERASASGRELASYRAKIAATKAAQQARVVDGSIPAADVLALVMSIATSWLSAPPPPRNSAEAATR